MSSHLRDLSKIYTLLEDSRRAAVYSKAAYSLEQAERASDGPINVSQLKGIGPAITQDLKEFAESGTSVRMSKLIYENREMLETLELFCTIHGIGIKYAKQLWLSGYRTLDDLKKGNVLTEAQRIALDKAADLEERIPRDEIIALGHVLFKLWKFEFEITGSFRRGLPSSGDIDILIKDTSIDDAVLSLVDAGIIDSDLAVGKNKYMGLLKVPGHKTVRRVDIMHIPAESWPFAIMYFTGSKEFNIAMRQQAKKLGYRLNEFGLTCLKQWTLVQGIKTEQDIFRILQVAYLPPNQR